LLGFDGELPGVPVVDELVPDWPDAAPVVPLVPEAPAEPVLSVVALAPIEELSLAPLVESVVLHAASATQNAAANIVFIIAMIFSFYKRVETIRLEALIIYKGPLDGRAFEFRQHFCRINATHGTTGASAVPHCVAAGSLLITEQASLCRAPVYHAFNRVRIDMWVPACQH